MPVVYRIIKYEADTQEELDDQLNPSVAPGFIYRPRPGVTITIKDRNDDPNEPKFFDDCIMSPHGMIRTGDLKKPI